MRDLLREPSRLSVMNIRGNTCDPTQYREFARPYSLMLIRTASSISKSANFAVVILVFGDERLYMLPTRFLDSFCRESFDGLGIITLSVEVLVV